MAVAFDVDAKLSFSGPANLKSIVNQVQSAFSSIKANVNINTGSSIGSIGRVKSAVDGLNNSLGALTPTAANAASALKALGGNNLKININAGRSITSLNGLTRGINSFNTAINTTTPNVARFNAALRGISTTIHGVQGNFSQLAGSASQISSAINNVNQQVKQGGKHVHTYGELLGETTRRFSAFSLIATGFASIILLTKKAVGETILFDREMVRVKQVTGATAGVIDDLKNSISGLSTGLGVSSQDLSKASVILLQAGLSAQRTKESLELLAKTSLTPNFEGIEKTTEGLIAIENQFKRTIKGSRDLESAFNAINTTSAAFAFESGDIIEAVKKAGGAFSAAGGDVREFVALFGAVRSTTRESADKIATALRTITARIQRPKSQKKLKDLLGIDLSDDKGNFVGVYKTFELINKALKDVPATSGRFAQIVEEVGGIRQSAVVIPLIQQMALSQKILTKAREDDASITRNAAEAQESLIVKLTKLQEKFFELFRILTDNTAFRSLIDFTIGMTDAALKLTKTLEPLVSLLTVVGTIKLGRVVGSLAPGISKGLFKKAKGGVVPGTGDTDSVPAHLEAGSFVLNKKSSMLANSLLTPGEIVFTPAEAKKIGYGKLEKMNRLKRFALGGKKDLDETHPHISPDEFASHAQDAANKIHAEGGGFGQKVFINKVHAEATKNPALAGMSLDNFKKKLLVSNQERHLDLARADMAPFADQNDIKASEISSENASFHFMRAQSNKEKSTVSRHNGAGLDFSNIESPGNKDRETRDYLASRLRAYRLSRQTSPDKSLFVPSGFGEFGTKAVTNINAKLQQIRDRKSKNNTVGPENVSRIVENIAPPPIPETAANIPKGQRSAMEQRDRDRKAEGLRVARERERRVIEKTANASASPVETPIVTSHESASTAKQTNRANIEAAARARLSVRSVHMDAGNINDIEDGDGKKRVSKRQVQEEKAAATRSRITKKTIQREVGHIRNVVRGPGKFEHDPTEHEKIQAQKEFVTNATGISHQGQLESPNRQTSERERLSSNYPQRTGGGIPLGGVTENARYRDVNGSIPLPATSDSPHYMKQLEDLSKAPSRSRGAIPASGSIHTPIIPVHTNTNSILADKIKDASTSTSPLALPSPLEAQRVNGAIPASFNPVVNRVNSPDYEIDTNHQTASTDVNKAFKPPIAVRDTIPKRHPATTPMDTNRGYDLDRSPRVVPAYDREPIGYNQTGYLIDTGEDAEKQALHREKVRKQNTPKTRLGKSALSKAEKQAIIDRNAKTRTASPVDDFFDSLTKYKELEDFDNEARPDRSSNTSLPQRVRLRGSSGLISNRGGSGSSKLSTFFGGAKGLFGGGNPSGSPPSSPPGGPPFGDLGGLGDKLKGKLKGKIGMATLLAGAAAPFVSEHLLGSAEKPGSFGVGGAKVGAVGGGALAGAAGGFAAAGPGGAIIGALMGGISSLNEFDKALEKVQLDKFGKSVDEAIASIGNNNEFKTKSHEANFNTQSAKHLDAINKITDTGIYADDKGTTEAHAPALAGARAKAFGSALLSPLHPFQAYDDSMNASTNAMEDSATAQKHEAALPKFQQLTEQVENIIKSNGGKTHQELGKDKRYSSIINQRNQFAKLVNGPDVIASNNGLSELSKSIKAKVDLEKKEAEINEAIAGQTNKLVAGIDAFSNKIDAAVENTSKSFATQSTTHDAIAGKITYGTNMADAAATGPYGKSLNDFSKTGGGYDQARASLRNALSSFKGEDTEVNPAGEQIKASLEGARGFKGSEGSIGKVLKDNVGQHVDGNVLAKFRKGDQEGAIDDALGKIAGQLKAKGEKSSAEIGKAMEMFGRAAVSIAEQHQQIAEGQAASASIGLGINRTDSDTRIKLGDTFKDPNGNHYSQEYASAANNQAFAGINFNNNQRIKYGVTAGNEQNGAAIGEQLKGAQSRLSAAKDRQLTLKNEGKPLEDQAKATVDIVNASTEVDNLTKALKSLAGSTELVDAAQTKLNAALATELGDKEARRKDAEVLTFGSAKDKQQLFKGQYLQQVAARQGNLNGFSDENKQLLLSRLQSNKDQVNTQQNFDSYGRERGISQYTNGDLLNRLNEANMRQSELPQETGIDSNGKKFRSSRLVANARMEVNAATKRQQEGQDVLNDVNLRDKNQRASELKSNVKNFANSVSEKTVDFAVFGKAVTDLTKISSESALITALTSFPKALQIERNGTIQVVLNGAEILASIKGDLESGIVTKIIDTIQKQLPQMIKNVPAG